MTTLKYVLFSFLFFVTFSAGFIYFMDKSDENYASTPETEKSISTKEAIELYKKNRYGEPIESECTWCGGAGKVGFAGESEKQVKRTRSGLGNICNVCKGSGKVKTYKK
jgi:Archaea-specific RecJ-like exonuclease, contains DnaJ-type Zn finger domain